MWTTAGERLLIEAEPNPTGLIIVRRTEAGLRGRAMTRAEAVAARGTRWAAHLLRCPDRATGAPAAGGRDETGDQDETRNDAPREAPGGGPGRSLAMSVHRCSYCQFLMPVVLVELGCVTHPCCDGPALPSMPRPRAGSGLRYGDPRAGRSAA